MRRILSLLMALVMATGVCLCISSCEEAAGASYSAEESTGHDIIENSAAKDVWDDFICGSKTKTIQAYFGLDIILVNARGVKESDFIRSNTEISEATDALRQLEAHIVGELTEDEVDLLDNQRLADSSEAVLIDLAKITMYDYSPEIIKGFGVKVGSGKAVTIIFNEEYLKIGTNACFALDGDVSSIADKIKCINEKTISVN